jgi:hypothetical protein
MFIQQSDQHKNTVFNLNQNYMLFNIFNPNFLFIRLRLGFIFYFFYLFYLVIVRFFYLFNIILYSCYSGFLCTIIYQLQTIFRSKSNNIFYFIELVL